MKTKSFKTAITAFTVIGVSALMVIASCTKTNQSLDVPPDTSTPPPTSASGDLLAMKTTVAPVIDGVVDAMWDNAQKYQFSTSVPEVTGDIFRGYVGNVVPSVTMRAAYDATNIYFLVEWADVTKSLTRQPWYFDPATKKWAQESGNYTFSSTGAVTRLPFYEDKVAFLWNINNSVSGWNSGTCYKSCHTGLPASDGSSRHFTNNSSEKIDMWHWKSVRGGVNTGQFEDQHQYNNYPNGRKGDGGNDVYTNNTKTLTVTGGTLVVSVPKYVIPGRAYTDENNWIFQSEIDANTAKQVNAVDANGVLTLSDATTIDPNVGTDYQRVGSGMGAKAISGITINAYTGSRADVTCKAVYTSGKGWLLEFTRALKTSDDIYDIDFSSLADQYFGFGIFENAQIAHSIKPNLKMVFQK